MFGIARPFSLAVATVTAAVLLSACGGATPKATPQAAPEAAKESHQAGFPVTVDNCGVSVTFKAPPKRVVTIHQHPAELMLALGLEKAMVGTAFPDSAVLEEYRAAYERVPELAKKEPSFETVLEADPDLVYGGYASAFTEKEGRGRKAFQDAGVNTYLNLEYCPREKLSVEQVYEEVRTVGKIFGVNDRAEALVGEMRKRLDTVAAAVKDVKPVPVFVYDSGDKSAFTAGGAGMGQEMIRLAGGENVFGDLRKVFGDVSWEQVVERKPEVILIYDYAGAGSVEDKKKFLLSHKPLADVPAVKNQRFLVVPLTATLVGVRPPAAVEELARFLHPKSFS
ncbi:ABC transporter substrate-binding protein [Sinosporangium siamense]|uniref:Lipoprotein n=1 Tax=Sinosporangium siamense TaxID=1367973 RepID=A0A919VA17_9ACTN|nr:ABC transporter substrate-binding protein [Sinosporangium siamense]GII95956.1 lipoprotein [Sinosporangium siamense]